MEQTSTTNIENDKKSKVLFIVNIVVNSIFYLFIFLLLIFSITQIAGNKEGKVKNFCGLGYETVLTDSMYVKERQNLTIVDQSRFKNTKSSFDAGDLVFVETLSKKEKKHLKVGQIVTFWDTKDTNPIPNAKGFLNTHRIVDFIYDTDGSISSVILQGDMYRGSDKDWKIIKENHEKGLVTDAEMTSFKHNGQNAADYFIQVVTLDVVKARYTGHMDNAGHFMLWLQNPKKGFVVVILFTVAFLIFEMFMVIKNLMGLKTEKMALKAEDDKEAIKEEMRKSLDEERERMRAELMAELQKERDTAQADGAEAEDTKPEDVTPESVAEEAEVETLESEREEKE